MHDIKRVMLVEDEALVAMLMEDFLESMEVEVVGVADSVSTALQLIDSVPCDAAFLDRNLRGGERSDAVAHALEERGIPYAFSSGSPEDAGGRPFLHKPFTLSDLQRVVACLR